MSVEVLKAFEKEIQTGIPSFRVRFKNESWLQKLIGFLIYPFNPQYMTKYATTMYPYVYFPSREHYETNSSSLTTLAHEFVHLTDTQEHPIWMRLSYMLPQIFALIPLTLYAIFGVGWLLCIPLASYLIGCVIARKSSIGFWIVLALGLVSAGFLAVWLSGWLALFYLLGLAALAPLPSPWRAKWEMRGYAISLAMKYWLTGSIPVQTQKSILDKFITSAYYYMDTDVVGVIQKIARVISTITNNTFQHAYPASTIYMFVKKHGLLVEPANDELNH